MSDQDAWVGWEEASTDFEMAVLHALKDAASNLAGHALDQYSPWRDMRLAACGILKFARKHS